MTAETSNLLGMAKTAELGGNMEEALGYYNRVLEIDPTIYDAWMGKGRAAGWQSTIALFRLPEAIIAFNHAISNVPGDQKGIMRNDAAGEVNTLVSALYGMCRNHMEEFANVPGTWESYLSQVRQMLDALDEAEKWDPANRFTLENIVHLSKDNIEGHVSRDDLNYGAESTLGLSPEYEALLQNHLDAAVARLQQIDPTYAAPQVEKKVGSDCFVVTATLNDNFHPDVITLRNFRDQKLAKSKAGERLILIYYLIGPRIAAQIRGSEILRKLSRIFIVTPCAFLAKALLRR